MITTSNQRLWNKTLNMRALFQVIIKTQSMGCRDGSEVNSTVVVPAAETGSIPGTHMTANACL